MQPGEFTLFRNLCLTNTAVDGSRHSLYLRADFSGTKGEGIRLRGNFRHASFTGSSFAHTSFRPAELSGANFADSELSDCAFVVVYANP